MPSQIVHLLHGRDVLKTLDPQPAALIHPRIFNLGLQGPDLFYHNQRTKPSGLPYGVRLHRSHFGRFVVNAVAEARQRGWGPEHPFFSYLAGFALHGPLDRIAHPFIIYFSGWKTPGQPETDILRRSHAFFERMMDVLLWEYLEKKNFSDCDWQLHLPQPEVFDQDFIDAYAQALWKTYPGLYHWEDGAQRVRNAFRDTLGFLQWTAPGRTEAALWSAQTDAETGSHKIALFHPVVLPPDDYLNLDHKTWLHPLTGQKRDASFPELYRTAVTACTGLIEKLLRTWQGTLDPAELEAALGNENLNLAGEDGVAGGAKFCQPLDFENLYAIQRRYWLNKARG